MYNSNSNYVSGVHKHNILTKCDTSNQLTCSSYQKQHFTCEYMTQIFNQFPILIVGIYMYIGILLVKFVSPFSGYMTNIFINQHLSTQKLYQNGLFIKCFFDGRPFSTFSPLIQLESLSSAQTGFWLAVHGKPVLFWNGTSGLKFPCFLFMHANGTGPFEFRAVPIL